MSGLFRATTIKGNRLTDFAVTTATVGVPIPFGYGSFLTDGNVIWAPLPPKETRTTRRVGKGGTKQESFTYTLSYAVAFCKGPITRYLWIKRNGKIVYTTDPGAPADDLAFSAKWLTKATLYLGTADQLPDSTIESYEGTGQVSAFRDLCYITVEDDDVTKEGGSVPSYEACALRGTGEIVTTPLYPVVFGEDLDVSVDVVGAELRSMLLDYSIVPEELNCTATLIFASLGVAIVDYNNWIAEPLDVIATLQSGELKTIFLTYDNWIAEPVDLTAALQSGELKIILLTYDNWIAENLDVTATLQSGYLGA